MILEKLYNGELHPAEEASSHDPAYEELCKQAEEQLRQLETVLSREQMEAVDRLCEIFSALICCEAKAKFEYGFSLGLRLMQETGALPYFRK